MANNIKEGYLQKETHAYGDYHPFEQRWVVLDGNSLVCHKTYQKNDITHIIDLNMITDVIIRNGKSRQFELIRKGSIENITFIADRKSQMNDWVHAIKVAAKLEKHVNIQQNNQNILKTHHSKARQKRASTTPTKEENKHLKKENKLLQKTVSKLKQKISKLKMELDRFKKQLKNKVRNDKYNILITESNPDEIDRQHNIQNISKYLRRRKSSKHKPKLLRSPPISAQTSPTSSDNEFESDLLSLGGDAIEVNTSYMGNICDVFNRLKSINEGKLIKMLMNEMILFDSKMKVFSSANNTYIDTAGILTKNNLYLISAINYQIWSEFQTRTKINRLIPYENDNDYKIDVKTANELVKNLDIIDDYKINESIKKKIIGKTKKEIKLNILLNDIPIKSLSNLFIELNDISGNEVASFQQLKDVNCVIIKDFYDVDIVNINERDKLLEHIFDEIPWIEQSKMNNSLVIRLSKYFAKSIISLLNHRKNKYFQHCTENKLRIEEYDNKIRYTQYQITVADIKNFNMLQLMGNINDMGVAFILKNKDKNIDNDIIDIQCLLHSNNLCQEWLTHLDYAMFDKSKLNLKLKDLSSTESETDSSKNKLLNDFTSDDAHFGFGQYLNYWENGYENTVIPKYMTLKQELLYNGISKISEKDYYWLYEQCMRLLKIKKYKIKAHEIGVNNKKFNIDKGTPITINHLISLKLYTDFAETQKKFKKTMRRKNRFESLQSLIERNCECAQWSRYIKEACTFYAKPAKNIILYTGLERKLLFSSMRQHFECPVSTTLNYNKAQGFCDDNGCVLKLKAGNSKTRYFDVSWLSRYREEQERLICASCLKICDIYVKSQSSKQYISAFLMFEQLINGQFIDTNAEKEEVLYGLIAHLMRLNEINTSKHNIDLFENMMKEMIQKYAKNELWINRDEINKIKHSELKQLFHGAFWQYFKIKQSNINWVQQYVWNICDDIYDKFKNMPPRKYILSTKYEFKYKSETIRFYLKCCAKYSEEQKKCALFLHIDKLSKNIKSVKIEYDLLCRKEENKYYRNLIMPQMLSNDKLYCGLQAFSSKCLNKTTSIVWRIGLKIIDVSYCSLAS